jgi:hypothetical protein
VAAYRRSRFDRGKRHRDHHALTHAAGKLVRYFGGAARGLG